MARPATTASTAAAVPSPELRAVEERVADLGRQLAALAMGGANLERKVTTVDDDVAAQVRDLRRGRPCRTLPQMMEATAMGRPNTAALMSRVACLSVYLPALAGRAG